MAGAHAKKRKRKSPVAVFFITLLILIVLAAAGCGFAYYKYQDSLKPVDSQSTDSITVEIPSGAGASDIGRILKDKGLIRSTFFFKLYSKNKGYDAEYKQGRYELSKAMSEDELMKAIISGEESGKIKFTIPEGFTTSQTIERIAAKGLMSTKEYKDICKSDAFDYSFLDGIKKNKSRFDGFLYPATYEFYDDADSYDVVGKMLDTFNDYFKAEYYERAAELGLSVREIVTIASLIERETGIDDERAVIAGVIYNRLEKNMRLQIDATIQYALPEPKQYLSLEDLKIDSPYNTYTHDGLPPGPICSPRIESIEAALYPEQNDFLYYVLKPEMNGEHNFASNDADFQKFKNEYKKANGLG